MDKGHEMPTLRWSVKDIYHSVGLLGGTFGVAGWIVGILQELVASGGPADVGDDVKFVVGCVAGVGLTGFAIWCLYLLGCRLRTVLVIEALLAASLVFGTIALVWIDARGLLPAVTAGRSGMGQPGNEIWEALGRKIPPRFVYVTPLMIAAMMAGIWIPPIRRTRWFSSTIQRGEAETPQAS